MVTRWLTGARRLRLGSRPVIFCMAPLVNGAYYAAVVRGAQFTRDRSRMGQVVDKHQ